MIEQILFFVLLGVLVLLGDGKQPVGDVVAAAGVLGLFIVRHLYKKQTPPPAFRINLAWVIILCYLGARTLFSDSMGYSISATIRWIMAYLVFVFFNSIPSENKSDGLLSRLIMWFGTFVVLAFIFVSVVEPLGRSLPAMNLLYASSGHNQVASVIIFLLPLVISRLISRKDTVSALLVLFYGGALALSFSRGAWALAVGYFSYLLVFNRKISIGIKIIIAGMVLVITAMFVFGLTVKSLPDGLLQHQLFKRQIIKVSIVESRASYWKESLSAIEQRPWFGAGPGTFYLLSKRFQDRPNIYSWFAHSFPLELAAELGFVGIFAIGVLVVFLWQKAATYASHDHGLRHGVVLTLVYSVYEMNLNFLAIWLLLWAVVGYLCGRQSKVTSEIKRNSGYLLLISLCAVTLFYVSSMAALLMGLFPGVKGYAFYAEPYSADRATSVVINSNISPVATDLIERFHNKNPEILFTFAKNIYPTDKEKADKYYRAAILLDPQNNAYVEEYATRLIADQKYDQLLWVIQTITAIISQNPQSDAAYLESHWAQMYPCVTGETISWPNGVVTHTYQAKSLYFMGLCLLKTGKADEARFLFRVATDARTGWSNIYLDYSALSGWMYQDGQEARRAIDLCKANQYARKHCSEYDNKKLPATSVTDPDVVFIR